MRRITFALMGMPLLIAAVALAAPSPIKHANATPDTWSSAASMAAVRYLHTATLLPDGNALIVGGTGPLPYSSSLASAELYDPVANTWSAAGSMATDRAWHTATLLPNGRVLAIGGISGPNVSNPDYVASAELYDPVANAWSPVASMATGRARHTATLLPNGNVLVVGGWGGANGSALANAELYDPVANTWSAAGSMATTRYSHSATLLPNGMVLATGGYQGDNDLASAEVYDPVASTWSAAGSMATARAAHTATLLPSGMLLVAGGASVAGSFLASAELYDPIANTWSVAGSLAIARANHTATLLPNGRVLVSGAISGSVYLASAELYDPVANTWSAAGSMVTARVSHTATLLSNGKVLAAGGDGGPLLASAELYDSAGVFPGDAEMVIDCDASTGAIESSCTIDGGATTQVIQIYARNTTGAAFTLCCFSFTTVSDNVAFASPPSIGSGLDANPDFNADTTALEDWLCEPPVPDNDTGTPPGGTDGDPTTAQSFISCYNIDPSSGPLIADGAIAPLARVSYNITGNGTVNFTLTDTTIFDDTFTGWHFSCAEADCYNASASRVELTATPTPTPAPDTPTPTFTPTTCPDLDCDGVLDAVDNCPSIPNTNQLNSDRNYIDHSPPYASGADDKTRPNSDAAGDACDPDDDNDGLADAVEVLAQPCSAASAPTDPALLDSDGDRFVDGVECAFGADPMNSASIPVFAACGPAGLDSDGDRISDSRETCFYNTDPENADTDGDRLVDGAKDGCEVASLNGDRIVSSGDQGMLAGGISGAFVYHVNIDLNKDGTLNSGDQGLMASFISPPGQCP